MVYLLLVPALFSVSLAAVPMRTKSERGDYALTLLTTQGADELYMRIQDLEERCSALTDMRNIYCKGVTRHQMINLLQQDDLIVLMQAMETIRPTTVTKHISSGRKRRSVPWNLDRLNQYTGVLDGSYMDEAEVDVYIVGSGIRVDHSEFENRARVGFSAYTDVSDCEGSGTSLASLVGGRSMGIARKANLIAVQVIDCDGTSNKADILNGFSYLFGELERSDRRSIVLIGFTLNTVDAEINSKIVSVSELDGGTLVVAGAGDRSDFDSCRTSPASAQGNTALNGVVTVGATDENDATYSNIGECVDIFAPGVDVPSAGSEDPAGVTTCTGTLCAAALAAGVVAASLRDNSRLDLETQKSILVNGATIKTLTLPPDNGDFRLTTLKAHTPQKILYYACGYYQEEGTPVCKVYTSTCDNNKVSTFDGNNVPIYEQKHKKCGFKVFTSEKNGVSFKGSHYDCSLGAYTLLWEDHTVLLLPGPTVYMDNMPMHMEGIYFKDESLEVRHVVDLDTIPREPLVIITLSLGGEPEVEMQYDGTSRLQITLLNSAKYKGETGGLCGFYDNDGTNDYSLPDGSQLASYKPSYHEQWMSHPDSPECTECEGTGCACADSTCTALATEYCSSKFQVATKECLEGVNLYKERLSCIAEVSKCCCQAKESGESNPDLTQHCCQNSYFGNFERNRESCSFCDVPVCEKEPTLEHCVDDAAGREHFDYMDEVTYSPRDCCYYIPGDKIQTCTAPRNQGMMWDVESPVCQEKICTRPDVPNTETIISPDKTEYGCGETVTVTCSRCHEINPEPQVIQCSAGPDEGNNDAHWNEEVESCAIITCPPAALPDVDNDKGVSYPLSWIADAKPHSDECGDRVDFHCDACYDMYGEGSAECEESARWTSSPRCRLRHCENPISPALEYPLTIRTALTACNDTIEYSCTTRSDDIDAACYDLVGSPSSTCTPADGLVSWNSARPTCQIRHCPAFTNDDLVGNGVYSFEESDEKTEVTLTSSGSNSPTTCGSEVAVTCDSCSFLCGPESRMCLPDGSWSEGRPRCEVRNCRSPVNDPTTSNSVYKPIKGPFECGDTVTFSCKDECHEYKEGTETHTCQPDLPVPFNPYESKADWAGAPYSCSIKQCPSVVAPDNGGVDSRETLCGTIIVFSCDECYVLEGNSELKCKSDKTWSHEVPKCVKKECPSPGSPIHGTGSDELSLCGDDISYSCDECYYLDGASSATCQDDRTWSHPMPRCEQHVCAQRDAPAHGWISNRNFHLCGDEVEFGCDDCYQIQGEDTAGCLHGGLWSDDSPVCNIKTCPRPYVPDNTHISPDKQTYNCGEYFKVECSSCYECESVDIHCMDGGWEMEVPSCGIKQCQHPGLLEMVNSTTDWGLKDGADLSRIVKSDAGIQKRAAVNPSVSNDDAPCGEELEYECDICYNLRGDKKIHCEDNKQWTTKPLCELKTCEQPEPLTEHLIMSPSQPAFSCNQPITYSCDDQCWSLDGGEQRMCNPSEGSNTTSWYPIHPPTCEIRECLPPLLEDPLVTYAGSHKCGSAVSFSCPPCFKLVGAEFATCTVDDVWDNQPPQCVPVCCPPLDTPLSGDPSYEVETMSFLYNVTGDSEQTDLCDVNHVCQRADATCQECYEYVRDGESYDRAPSRECKHPGVWSNVVEMCTRKQCEARQPASVQHIRYKDTLMETSTNCGDEVEFECKACYENLEGVMSHTCLPSKEWGSSIPTCSLKECPELPHVHNSCRFEEGYRTCGSDRELQCDSCYYTSGCEEKNTDLTSLLCTIAKSWEWKVGEPAVNIKTCSPPPEIDHASFVKDGEDFSCGRVVKYECDECYEFAEAHDCNCAEVTCVGSHSSDCSMGSWEGKFPICTMKECEQIPTPDNANVIQMESSCGGTAQFECEPGYEQVSGDLIRTCRSTKEWSGSQPVCRIRNCTALEAPSHGSVSTEERHYGTVASFHCDPCYQFPKSMIDPSVLEKSSVYPRYHILACESHGNWNGSEPVCQRKYCGRPESPGTADIDSSEFFCGDQVAFTCKDGYYQSGGDSVRECGEDSKWDGEPFQCEVKTCPAPRQIENSDYSPELDEYQYKSSVEYDCDYCHQYTGQLEISCENFGTDQTKNGMWDPADLPKCSRIQCPSVSPSPHSKLMQVRRQLEKKDCSQILVTECDEGYQLEGQTRSIFCQSSGKWTDSVPKCDRRCCPERTELEDGLITNLDDSQCFGDRIKHTCDTCYELVGASVQTCEASGRWSSDKPHCRLIQCKNTPFDKGTYSDSNSAGYCGSERTFSCYPGYSLRGSHKLTCLDNGLWSGSVPYCEQNPCTGEALNISNGYYRYELMSAVGPTSSSEQFTTAPFLPTIEPGADYLNYYPLWTVVYFVCDQGYELIGQEELYCNENGKWSMTTPRCTREMCPLPTAPEHGEVSYSHLKEGGIASFSCDECFRLEGYTQLQCSEGEWTPQHPVSCVENVCYPPGEEENSYILDLDTEKTRYSCGDEVHYACEEGYHLHGDESRTCGSDGRWSGRPPVCPSVECPAITSPDNGGMSHENGTDYFMFWCNKGYQLSGDSVLLCVKGQWQGVEPKCAIQVCGDPGLPDFSMREGDRFTYGDQVSYRCKTGYQIRGPSTIRCTHKGEWDYSPPYCVCNECPRQHQPANGYVLSTDANSYASVIEYVCYPGYEIVGNASRTCQASGEWSGEAPFCSRVNCTENYKVPQGGFIAEDAGHKYQDQIEIKCPNLKGGWTRTCQADGLWSGNIPDRCDCKQEVRKVPVRRTIVKPASCILGRCSPRTERTVVIFEEREFTICA